jgi:crotonobetaine/carnitine-CoA ligase
LLTLQLDQPYTARQMLEHHASHNPEMVLLRFDSGEMFTAKKLLSEVRLRSGAFLELGVSQGDPVLLWIPNSPEIVLSFLALNYIGAVAVPINTAYKGGLLEHVIMLSKSKLLVGDARLLPLLDKVNTGALRRIVAVGNHDELGSICTSLPVSSAKILRPISVSEQTLLRLNLIEVLVESTQCVIFTSGTTGPSKGVLCSYQHTFRAAQEFKHVGPGDTNLVALPMFHIGGVLGINFALIHGGCAAFVERFRTSTFWCAVRQMQVTSAGLLGTMVQFLLQQSHTSKERDHPLKRVVIAPYGQEALEFSKRFGVDVYTEFNMTELSVPLWCGPNDPQPGTCGVQREGVELKLMSPTGTEVIQGETGELWVKPASLFDIAHGYLHSDGHLKEPDRGLLGSSLLTEDGWFRTGDLFQRNSAGYYFYVDRLKDMIRRRGENISSFEVEKELLKLPGVVAVAAVAVAGDGGEDEILAILQPLSEVELDPIALLSELEDRLPAFMVPRYIRVVENMPITPTQKIEKHVLRNVGVTSETFDRVKAGYQLKRRL